MPLAVHSDDSGGYEQPKSLAGAMQITTPNLPVPVPLQIADGATYDSGIVFSDGYKAVSVAVTADHAGSLKVIRYIDLAGSIVQATSTTSIVANTALVVNVFDNLPFVTYRIQIVNGAGAVSNIASFAALMNAT
jgi:hypothetical protein